MTVVVGWIREINDAQELIIASDSRLCGGYRWDNCPKILTFPRNDCAIALMYLNLMDFYYHRLILCKKQYI